MNILLILRNLRSYRLWLKAKKGGKVLCFRKGPGYYFTTGIIGHNPIGTVQKFDMQSGRKAVAELVDYRCYRDPDDMIEWSIWHIIEYVGFKKAQECSFKEFLEIYILKK